MEMASDPTSSRGLVKDLDPETHHFLESTMPIMDWSLEQEDVVMDVGCREGSATREQILACHPNIRKIVAIDLASSNIELAKSHYAHPKIDYYRANIEDRSTLQPWMGQMTKIISSNFPSYQRPENDSFQNIYDLLKPGGEAALLSFTKMPIWTCYTILAKYSKWTKYLRDYDVYIPPSHVMGDCCAYFKEVAQRVGFNVVLSEPEEKLFTFDDEDSCRRYLYSICPLMDGIPASQKSDFMEDFFSTFVHCNSRNSRGRPMMLYTTLRLLLRKPE